MAKDCTRGGMEHRRFMGSLPGSMMMSESPPNLTGLFPVSGNTGILHFKEIREVCVHFQLDHTDRRFPGMIANGDVLQNSDTELTAAFHDEMTVRLARYPSGSANEQGTVRFERVSRQRLQAPPLIVIRQRDMMRVSSKKTPWGRSANISPVTSEIEKFDPSTRVTAPPTEPAAVSAFHPTIAGSFAEYRVNTHRSPAATGKEEAVLPHRPTLT